MLDLVNEYTSEDKKNHQKAKEMIIEKFLKTGIKPQESDFTTNELNFILANSKCGYKNTLISCKLDYATPFVFKGKSIFVNLFYTVIYKFIISLYNEVPPENIDLSYKKSKSNLIYIGTKNKAKTGFSTSISSNRIRNDKIKEAYLIVPLTKFMNEKIVRFDISNFSSYKKENLGIYTNLAVDKVSICGVDTKFDILEQSRVNNIIRSINNDENYEKMHKIISKINHSWLLIRFMESLYPYMQAKLNNQYYDFDNVIKNTYLIEENESSEIKKEVVQFEYKKEITPEPEEPTMPAVETPNQPTISEPYVSISTIISNVHSDFYVAEAELNNNMWSFTIDSTSDSKEILLIGTENHVIKNAWRIPREMITKNLIIIYNDKESNKSLNKFNKYETLDIDYLNSLIA